MLTNASGTAAESLVLAVRIGDALYGLPLLAIEEVLPALPVDPLPQCPDALRGVVCLRGQWIPILDAAARLGVARQRPDEPPIVCVRSDGRLVGIEVDEVLDLLHLDSRPTLSAADLGIQSGAWAAIADVAGVAIRVLNVQRLCHEAFLKESAAMT